MEVNVRAAGGVVITRWKAIHLRPEGFLGTTAREDRILRNRRVVGPRYGRVILKLTAAVVIVFGLDEQEVAGVIGVGGIKGGEGIEIPVVPCSLAGHVQDGDFSMIDRVGGKCAGVADEEIGIGAAGRVAEQIAIDHIRQY